jgi:hypothetical protein
VSQAVLQLNEGTGKQNSFITKSGMKQLSPETENWERIAGVIGRVLSLQAQ